MNFAVNFVRFLRTLILYNKDNHIQNRCSKISRKIHGKTPVLESLFDRAAGLLPVTLFKRHFSTCVFLWILKNFQERFFYRTPLDDCLTLTPPPCGFSKIVSSEETLKPWFFVTFNIILKHIFPENFIEFPQVVQKIWRISLSILVIFINFPPFFGFFDITLLKRN